MLELARRGNITKTFTRYTLAPLTKSGMMVYEKLRGDIFGLDGNFGSIILTPDHIAVLVVTGESEMLEIRTTPETRPDAGMTL